jgi:cyclohexa-1,5-dienecarbonyl-CoA hydratase
MAIRLEKKDDVAYVTLAAPPLNIMTCAFMDELADRLDEAAADDGLKAVAITAEGKAFSAGADVGEHHPDQAPKLIESFSRLFRILGGLEIPVVMGIDGAALGAGFELVQLADVLVASERAKFGQPEIRLAFFAPVGVAWLPALVGTARAMEITCSGRIYSAEEMRELGLVRQVVPTDALEETVEGFLDDFRKASPLILRLNVRMLKRLRGKPFEEARLEAEAAFLEDLMATEDVREGVASFEEKRPPQWRNR